MLKKLLGLSDDGVRELNKGIVATAIANLAIMAPVSLLMVVTMALLDKLCAGKGLTLRTDVILLMAIGLCGMILLTQWIQYNLTFTVAYRESANRRITLAEKLRRLPLSFFSQRDLSDLTSTIMGDCSLLERMFANAVPGLFGTIVMFLVLSIGLLCVDWRMGLCISLPVPVAGMIVFAGKKMQQRAEEKNYDAYRAAYDGVQEYLDVISELRSSGMESKYLTGLRKKLDHVIACAFRNELVPGTVVTLAQFFLRFGLVAVLLVGGALMTQGKLSVNMFLLYLLIAGRIYEPFGSCFMLMAEMFSALVSIRRTKEMEATPEQTGANVCNNRGFDIEFDNVKFSYKDTPVLDGVSFVAKQGEVTALVGHSGSGKSTVSRLAARFWDADQGKVLLGGVDVTSIDSEVLYRNYSIVFQDVTLFDNTVMENIRLGRQNATDEEVLKTAKAARCEEFVSNLPEGYHSMIGEDGCTLSGGERQRISIARAILKDAPVIILDEATASMDVENESMVQEALSELLRNKTVLVIAHHMRTIAGADKIVVLENGRVAEQGNPEELMKNGGIFSNMARLQMER